MRISTKGRYGLRLMIDLAHNYGKGYISLVEIAQRQGISEKYSWQLIAQLKNAGLVNSTRGAQGGYSLARKPKEINLAEIITVLEGAVDLAGINDSKSTLSKTDRNIDWDIWEELSVKIFKTLNEFSLEDILEKERKRNNLVNYTI